MKKSSLIIIIWVLFLFHNAEAQLITYHGTGESWTNIDSTTDYTGTVEVTIVVSDVLTYYDDTAIPLTSDGWYDAGLGKFEINEWSIVGDAIGTHEGNGGGLFYEFWNPEIIYSLTEGNMNTDGFFLTGSTLGEWGGAFELLEESGTSLMDYWSYHHQSDPNYLTPLPSPRIWLNGSIQVGDHFGIDVLLDQQTSSVDPVPEPGSFLLILSGLIVFKLKKSKRVRMN